MATKTTTKKTTTKAPKAAKPAKKAAAVKVAEAPKKKATVPPTAPVEKSAPKKHNLTGNYFYANGKRKTSVAMVRLYKGNGSITINDRAFENYFPVFTDQDKILSPLRMSNVLKAFDISAWVQGGGIHSQAEAVRHGIAKALLEHDIALRTALKHAGYLTRDSRVKERKKYGLRRARRAPQFSKR